MDDFSCTFHTLTMRRHVLGLEWVGNLVCFAIDVTNPDIVTSLYDGPVLATQIRILESASASIIHREMARTRSFNCLEL